MLTNSDLQKHSNVRKYEDVSMPIIATFGGVSIHYPGILGFLGFQDFDSAVVSAVVSYMEQNWKGISSSKWIYIIIVIGGYPLVN